MYEPIAIVGCGCLYPPDSFSLEKFYENIINGTEGIRQIDEKFWEPKKYYNPDRTIADKTYCKQSAYLDPFDAPTELLTETQIPKETYNSLNRTQKMVLHTILQALSFASYSLEDIKNAGLFIGNMLGDPVTADYILYNKGKKYQKMVYKKLSTMSVPDELSSWSSQFNNKLSQKFNTSKELDKTAFPSALASKVADILNLNQISMVMDGACSGSLIVIDEAIKCIHQNKMNLCIVTGALGNMGVSGNVAFSKVGGLSDKPSVPLDKAASGLTPGEGAGSIIIKKLKDALNDKDTILGVIRGSGVASDGGGQSIYAPSTRGQHAAMRKSLDRANMTMKDIDYVELHATGTSVGDRVEVRSILQLCEEDKIQKPIAIGSVKSQIGHSFSGAGMANIFKVLLAMKENILPPTHKFNSLHHELGDVSDFLYVNEKVKEWKNLSEKPRRAMVNAFGFGGINGNILLEEFKAKYHHELIESFKKDISNSMKERKYAVISYGYFDDESNKDDFVFPFIKFKIPPLTLNKIDEAQQMGLLGVSNALEREEVNIPKKKTGIFVGSIFGLKSAYFSDVRIRSVEYTAILKEILGDTLSDKEYQDLEEEFKSNFETIEEDTLPGYMDNIVAGRIANIYDTQGTNATYDMDVGSFVAALHQGLTSLNNNDNDLIIVGGVNCNDMEEFYHIYKEAGSSSSKVSKGACFFIIKREEDVQPNDKVYAYITEPKFNKSSIKKDQNNKTDYMGATEAFVLLKKIVLCNEEKKRIKHISSTLSGRSFTYDIIPECCKDSIVEEDKYFAFYTEDTDLSILIQSLENIYSKKEIPQSDEKKKSQVAIVFKDYEELSNQINFLKKVDKI